MYLSSYMLIHPVSAYMKQAKEESLHEQSSNLVDALKNLSSKICLLQINTEK